MHLFKRLQVVFFSFHWINEYEKWVFIHSQQSFCIHSKATVTFSVCTTWPAFSMCGFINQTHFIIFIMMFEMNYPKKKYKWRFLIVESIDSFQLRPLWVESLTHIFNMSSKFWFVLNSQSLHLTMIWTMYVWYWTINNNNRNALQTFIHRISFTNGFEY